MISKGSVEVSIPSDDPTNIRVFPLDRVGPVGTSLAAANIRSGEGTRIRTGVGVFVGGGNKCFIAIRAVALEVDTLRSDGEADDGEFLGRSIRFRSVIFDFEFKVIVQESFTTALLGNTESEATTVQGFFSGEDGAAAVTVEHEDSGIVPRKIIKTHVTTISIFNHLFEEVNGLVNITPVVFGAGTNTSAGDVAEHQDGVGRSHDVITSEDFTQ